jgi:tubulin epsilon
MQGGAAVASSAGGGYNAAAPTANTDLPYDSMNSIAAQMLSNLTCGVRFPGQLNLDISDITTNLVPFPRIHFLVSSIAPLSLSSKFSVGASGGGTSAAAAAVSSNRAVDAMFSAVLERSHQLVDCDARQGVVLSSAFVCRGANVDVGDVARNVPWAKQRMHRVWWGQDSVKTAVCAQPPLGAPHSMLMLSNNCAVGTKLGAYRGQFMQLYRARSHMHHYTQYVEPSYFDDTLTILGDVIDDYASLQASTSAGGTAAMAPSSNVAVDDSAGSGGGAPRASNSGAADLHRLTLRELAVRNWEAMHGSTS